MKTTLELTDKEVVMLKTLLRQQPVERLDEAEYLLMKVFEAEDKQK